MLPIKLNVAVAIIFAVSGTTFAGNATNDEILAVVAGISSAKKLSDALARMGFLANPSERTESSWQTTREQVWKSSRDGKIVSTRVVEISTTGGSNKKTLAFFTVDTERSCTTFSQLTQGITENGFKYASKNLDRAPEDLLQKHQEGVNKEADFTQELHIYSGAGQREVSAMNVHFRKSCIIGFMMEIKGK